MSATPSYTRSDARRAVRQTLTPVAHDPFQTIPSLARTGTLPAERRRAVELWDSISEQLLATDGSSAERLQRRHQVDRVYGAWGLQRLAISNRSDDDDQRCRVVVADDEQVIRAIVRAFMGREQHLRLVAEADSAWSTVGVVAAEQPDILILDYDLGDAASAAVIGHVRTLSPRTRVVLHSARTDVQHLGREMDVDGVVAKGQLWARLSEALRMLAV